MLLRKLLRLRIPSVVVNIKAKLHDFDKNANNAYTTSKISHGREHLRLTTVRREIEKWCRLFDKKGITEPLLSIQHILAFVLELKPGETSLDYQRILNTEEFNKLQVLCNCRLERMPVPYIINEWDFRHLTLTMKSPVFIPRPETEKLVDLVVDKANTLENNTVEVLDVGCGTGAISIALTSECPKIKCAAIDTRRSACKLTRANVLKHDMENQIQIYHAILKESGVIMPHAVFKRNEIAVCNYIEPNEFDIIVSNPPYIPTKEIKQLQPEISIFEDNIALDGGPDGLSVIKPLLKYAAKHLKIGGTLFMEVDPRQPEQIKRCIYESHVQNLSYENTHNDFACKERYVEIKRLR